MTDGSYQRDVTPMALKYYTADQITTLTSRLHLLRVALGSGPGLRGARFGWCDLRDGQWLDAGGHLDRFYRNTSCSEETRHQKFTVVGHTHLFVFLLWYKSIRNIRPYNSFLVKVAPNE